MTTTTTTPQLYVGTYAKYNSGSIAGEWMDLTSYSDAAEFMEAIKELHSDETDPEFMFQDYEGFPKSFYSESMSEGELEKLYEYVNMDESDKAMIDAYVDATGYSMDDVNLSDVQDCFQGVFESGADFAEQTCEECGYISKNFPSWIVVDWEATWNCNLRHDYNYADMDNGFYIFSNC